MLGFSSVRQQAEPNQGETHELWSITHGGGSEVLLATQ